MSKTFTASVELPAVLKVPTYGADKTVLFETTVDLQAIMAANPVMLRFAALAGFIGALNDVSRGKDDKTGAANSDAVFESMRAKRAAVWLTGVWSSKGGGGERALTAVREAYVDDVRAKTGASVREVEANIKATVASAFGDKEPATFAKFIEAMGLALAKNEHGDKATAEQVGEAREAFEAHYQALADQAAKARAAAGAKVDLTSLTLAAFAKVAKAD